MGRQVITNREGEDEKRTQFWPGFGRRIYDEVTQAVGRAGVTEDGWLVARFHSPVGSEVVGAKRRRGRWPVGGWAGAMGKDGDGVDETDSRMWRSRGR